MEYHIIFLLKNNFSLLYFSIFHSFLPSIETHKYLIALFLSNIQSILFLSFHYWNKLIHYFSEVMTGGNI